MMSTLSNQTACIPKLSGELINKNPWIWTKCGLKGWLKISEKGCVWKTNWQFGRKSFDRSRFCLKSNSTFNAIFYRIGLARSNTLPGDLNFNVHCYIFHNSQSFTLWWGPFSRICFGKWCPGKVSENHLYLSVN